jgi:hypothetical protein
VNGWTVAAFLVGWILGVVMSYRKVRRSERIQKIAADVIAKRIFSFLEDIGVIKITITEDGEKTIETGEEELASFKDLLDAAHDNGGRKH